MASTRHYQDLFRWLSTTYIQQRDGELQQSMAKTMQDLNHTNKTLTFTEHMCALIFQHIHEA